MTTHNATQIEFWNGETGHNWVTHDALMEAMLQPLGEAVMDTLAPRPGEHVLDIGCGCGHTSLNLADRIGASGSVTGIDISTPMLEVATPARRELQRKPHPNSVCRSGRANPHFRSGAL